ncbi:MAG TPA: phenol hydroxylase subunit P4, partial [Mycobacterium sp.]|nr:phenol hydroxylase subunit P4 [Mycobacterium sp.]
VFGDDQLVYVLWDSNPLLCSAACFRVPKAMAFGEFLSTVVHPWAASDPDFDAAAVHSWRLFDEAMDPGADRSLAELGVGHKALLLFSTH